MSSSCLRFLIGFFACFGLSASCTKENRHAVVVVSTTGIDADVSALQASITVAGVAATEVQDFTAAQSVFSLQLPDGANGEVSVTVTALGDTGCTVSRGQGSLQVSGIGRYDLAVPLSRLPQPDCQTTVELAVSGVSAEVRRLSLSASLDGSAIATRTDYAAATQRITLQLGDAVSGAFNVTVDGFGCKSCQLSHGSAMLQLTSYGRHVVSVPLVPLSQPTCAPNRGTLLTARYAHTATLLESGPFAGQVVVIAGDAMGSLLTSAERYDPRTGVSSPAGGLLLQRYGHTATLLTSGADRGRILVTGGYNGQWISEVEIYDPQSGLSRAIASLRNTVFGHTATPLVDGRVVVIGGHDGNACYRSVDIFDPLTQTWSPADDAPATEYQHTATLLADGHILVAGGRLQSSAIVATAAVFDPSAPRGSQWMVAGDLATGRAAHRANLLPGGQVLVSGGYGSVSQTLDSAELFLPTSRAFVSAPPLMQPRGAHGAILLSNGRLFFSGGMSAFLDQLRADGELYDAASGGRSSAIPLSIRNATQTATLLPDDGVLLVGGLTAQSSGDGVVTAEIELLFPLGCAL